MRALTRLAAAVAMVLVASSQAFAQQYTMKFGCASINDPQWQYLVTFKEELDKRSGGRIDVELYPQSQLGPIPRQIEGVQLGTIEAFAGPVDFFVGSDPRFGVLSAPMLFRDNANIAATVTDPGLYPELLAMGEPKGFVGIGFVVIGMTNYAATTPLLTIADFQGKKLRINGTDLEREKMSRLGATGLPLPLGDVLPALQRGTIDGTQSATSIFVAMGFRDAVDTLTVTNDTAVVTMAVVSKVWLETLPADLQEAVKEAGLAAQAAMVPWQQEFVETAEQKWLEMDGKIHTLPEDEQERFAELLATVADDVTKGQPEVFELLQKVRSVAASH